VALCVIGAVSASLYKTMYATDTAASSLDRKRVVQIAAAATAAWSAQDAGHRQTSNQLVYV